MGDRFTDFRRQFFSEQTFSSVTLIWGAWILFMMFGNPAASVDGATYSNPIAGSITMGDPFILADRAGYFLYGTTAVGEGFKCWFSTNLTDWTDRGLVFQKKSDSWGQQTFWAPEVIRYGNRFYLVYSSQPANASSFSARICLAVSPHPDGPFEDLHAPLFDNGWSCIDGHIFVDSDGSPFLYFTKVGVTQEASKKYLLGINYGVKLKSDLNGLDGHPVLCTQADQPWERPVNGRSRCTEGAFVFKRGDTYYMTYSANHYAEPFYGIGYATAPSPLGPWTKSPDNPLVAQNAELGISGPGHNCVITSPDGNDRFMVYHVHADPEKPSGRRVVFMDRLRIADDGRLELIGPTKSPQPLPFGL